MNYRIPTVPMRGRRPKLSLEDQQRYLAWRATRKVRKGMKTVKDWAKELNVCPDTLTRYRRGEQKFPVRA
jgi:hypothetical protein